MLTFNLKKEWFEKIKNGEKTHEYRVQNKYWISRIKNFIGWNSVKERLDYVIQYDFIAKPKEDFKEIIDLIDKAEV